MSNTYEVCPYCGYRLTVDERRLSPKKTFTDPVSTGTSSFKTTTKVQQTKLTLHSAPEEVIEPVVQEEVEVETPAYDNPPPVNPYYQSGSTQSSYPRARRTRGPGKFFPGVMLGFFGGIIGFIVATAAIRMKKTTQGALTGFLIRCFITIILIISSGYLSGAWITLLLF